MPDNSTTRTFRVGYAHLPPFVSVNVTNGIPVLGGFMPDILFAVAKWMNFNVELYRESSDKYGDFVNGTWDGMIGMVYKNEVDFLMNPIVPREPILAFSYFTNPITIEAFTVLSGKEKKEAGLFLYFSVLDKWVWNAILIAFVIVALTSAILYQKIVRPTDTNWIGIFSQYIWLLFSYMLRQNSKEYLLLRRRRSIFSYFLSAMATLWALEIGFLIMNTFQSLLVSKLTLNKPYPLVETVDDFVKRKTILGVAPDNIQLSHVLKNSGIKVYEKAWEKIKRNQRPPEIALSTESLLEVESGKICLFHGHLIIKHILSDFYRKRATCKLHLSDKYFFPFFLPMILSRKIPYSFYEKFNRGITRLVDADLPGKAFKSDLRDAILCTGHFENELKPLGLENIHGVLLLWGAGLITATITFFCEIMHGKYKKYFK